VAALPEAEGDRLARELRRVERELVRNAEAIAELPASRQHAAARRIALQAIRPEQIDRSARRTERAERIAWRHATDDGAPELGADTLDNWSARTLGDTRALASSAARAVVRDVRAAARDDVSLAEVRGRWRDEGIELGHGGTLGGQLEVLARQGTAQLATKITHERARAAGHDAFEWSTAGDTRVRATHAALDGQVFEWAHPPPVGLPGDEPGCRCRALPVVDVGGRIDRMRVTGPDEFMDEGPGRYEAEAVGDAWALAWRDFATHLQHADVTTVLVPVGPPGAGKSHWIRHQPADSAVLVFDATWCNPARRVALCRRIRDAGKRPVAVVYTTPLQVCLARNDDRPNGRKVPRGMLERSALQLKRAPVWRREGWAEVLTVDGSGPDAMS
jgi:SPP1 gp7 family putative phage head morphogenesis protein